MQQSFFIPDIEAFKGRLIHYLRKEPVFCLLDSNNFYQAKDLGAHPYYHTFDMLAGFGVRRLLKAEAGNALEQLRSLLQQKTWLFGYMGYDVKNEIEQLRSGHHDGLHFPDLFFFEPEVLILLKGNELTVQSSTTDADTILKDIQDTPLCRATEKGPVKIASRISRETYLSTVAALRNHIIEGDVYEINFCQEFYAEEAEIDPFDTFTMLNEVSPQPFSSFLRIEDRYIMCSSMERYLKKEGRMLVSQPIKGTVRRGADSAEDEALQRQLLTDEKERAENVMIVDLVRNDLARCSMPGSVKVEELFGIYEFPQVYHMISTVTSRLKPSCSQIDAIYSSFPMGSMTGAPKVMAMELIEKYEQSRRGVYSGAIGYFSPHGDFDFNVVIRTILYNAASRYLSFQVGSAITYDSVPEKEYEECLVKIKGILKVLGCLNRE